MRWTRKGIIAEIKRLHASGAALNYAAAQAEHLNLVRAASWHFGTWRHAVEKAGISYQDISKYRRWNRERIIARVRELKEAGADLSWRAVSTQVDPPLAAAALRPNGFGSWREAIAAAGLDIALLARYRHWDEERVTNEIKALHREGIALSSRSVQGRNQSLFCAARRRFGSWDAALQHAGFNASDIRLRRPSSNLAAPNDIEESSSQTTRTMANARSTRNAARETSSASASTSTHKSVSPKVTVKSAITKKAAKIENAPTACGMKKNATAAANRKQRPRPNSHRLQK